MSNTPESKSRQALKLRVARTKNRGNLRDMSGASIVRQALVAENEKWLRQQKHNRWLWSWWGVLLQATSYTALFMLALLIPKI